VNRPGDDEDRPAPDRRAPFTFPVRVYYEDTDAGGVVYYANYLRFMERARTEWLARLGFPLAELEQRHARLFVVTRVAIDFRRPARLQDDLGVTVEVQAQGACRIHLRQRIHCAGEAVTDAEVTLACVEPSSLKPRRIPAALVAALETLQ
jgi:tol-pal system-associated acyl-CoA thioesterase